MPRITLSQGTTNFFALLSSPPGDVYTVDDPQFPDVLGVDVRIVITYDMVIVGGNPGLAEVQYTVNNGSSWALLDNVKRVDLAGTTSGSGQVVSIGNVTSLANLQLRAHAYSTGGVTYVEAAVPSWYITYMAPARGVVMEA